MITAPSGPVIRPPAIAAGIRVVTGSLPLRPTLGGSVPAGSALHSLGAPAAPGSLSFLLSAAAGGDAAVVRKRAATALSALRAVYVSADGLRYADHNDLVNADAVLGITTGAAAAQSDVLVQTAGEMSDPAWAWVPNEPIFLGANGLLTQSPAVAGLHVELATSLTPTSLLLRIQRAIIL